MTYDILGFSPGFLSMVIDILVKRHGKDLSVKIIKNLDHKDNTPFKIEGLLYVEMLYNQWDKNFKNLFLGVGKIPAKKSVFEFFNKNFSIDFKDYCNVIHPCTNIAETVKMGHCIFTNYGVSIGPFSIVGSFVTLNRHVGIGHHTKISDFCVLNPGVNIAGFCEVGEGTAIGMGSSILEGIKIGQNSVIGAGSIVNKDIPDNVVAYGVPVKVISENN